MAENRHRTVLEIKTDQTQAEIDIKRLQDMVDQLQKAAANIGFGGGAGGGVSGASGGSAPNPPRTDSGAGGAGGGAASPPPATGGGPGGSPAGTSGAGAPGGPGVGGGGGAGGGGGPGGGGPGMFPGGMQGVGLAAGLRSMGLGRFAGAAGAMYAAHQAVGAVGRATITPSGYFTPGEQIGFDLAGSIPVVGQIAERFRQAGERYGEGASEAGRLLTEAGMVEMAGFNTGLNDRDFLARGLGARSDSVARQFLAMGYGNEERIRLGNQLVSSAGRSLSGLNVGSAARMTRGGADISTIGSLIRTQREFGATGVIGDTAVDVLGRRGLGGIESLMATNQAYGYTGAALGELSKQQAQAFSNAQMSGLQRDLGDFTQTQSDIMRLGIGGFRAAQMEGRTTSIVGEMTDRYTSPFGDIGKTLLEARALEESDGTYPDIVRTQESMTTADIVETIQRDAASKDEGALMLKDMMKITMDEADRLMEFDRGAGDIEDQVQVQGGLAAARARALGDKDKFAAIEKEDITKLIKALDKNAEATLKMGRQVHNILGR